MQVLGIDGGETEINEEMTNKYFWGPHWGYYPEYFGKYLNTCKDAFVV